MIVPPSCRSLPRAAALLATVLLAAAPARPSAAAEDCSWPQFQGSRRDNVSTETGLLRQWPDDGPRLLWTARGLGHGFSSVAIAGGLLATAGNLDDQTAVTVLNLDGSRRWQVTTGPAWTGSSPGSRGTPTLDGDRLYHESALGEVVCLEAATGKRLWGRNILDEFGSKNITWAVAESVLIDGRRLICCPGGPETAMVALDKMTGETLWRSPSAGDLAGYGSPVLVEHEGLRMIVTMTSKAVIAVGADDGRLLWRFPHETPWDENIATPIHHDGHLFVSTQFTGSVLLRLKTENGRPAVEAVWRSDQLDNHHGGVVLLDGYLYGSGRANGNRWACLDWKTGELKYLERGVGKGTLTTAEGMLYTLSEQGLLGLVPATPEAHEIVSQFRIPRQGEGPVWARPVICGGRLYVRHGEYLYCYDIKAE
jgi:outer membrane protein assembly factor BamB